MIRETQMLSMTTLKVKTIIIIIIIYYEGHLNFFAVIIDHC